ncbi:exodeoxyribonuclease V subunit alpha [Corallincola platygyrae]|uniref:RecBCD enzyme subunit RecD n=1 Tax=Corallincola platygyrae TaxID=1193278 RepID=A0ABW4XS63_9GAMM
MSYQSSEQCMAQLSDIEAIDYFFAKQMLDELSAELTPEYDEEEQALSFHIFLALQWSLRQGHSCLPLSALAEQTYWQDHENDQPGYQFPALALLQSLCERLNITGDANLPVVLEQSTSGHVLYLRRYWQFEREVAHALKQRMLLDDVKPAQLQRVKTLFPSLFPNVFQATSDSQQPDWQQVAVANAIGRKLSVISGGPGTGKTYTVARLLVAMFAAAEQGDFRVMMAAPTGKAAQRLKESIMNAKGQMLTQGIDAALVAQIPDEASTLHRLLGFRPQSLQLKHDQEQPLHCDLLLIDEVSMIDLPMMARVLRALPEHASLVLLGDSQQLPSVETGCVMADLSLSQVTGYSKRAAAQIAEISGQKVPVSEQGDCAYENASDYDYLTLLTESRRFGGEIGEFAQKVIGADASACRQMLLARQQTMTPEQSNFSFAHKPDIQLTYIDNPSLDNWLKAASYHYFQPIAKQSCLDDAMNYLEGFRFLVPGRQGERGVEGLNLRIEQWLAKRNSAITPGSHYQGRPVMIVENSYSTGLFNGDVGLIWPDETGRLVAWFEQEEGGYKRISLGRLPRVETVYAMTIHKTQGSEFKHVAIVLPEQESQLLSPELLYTGLTRAREHLYVAGDLSIWLAALSKSEQRYSLLRQRLSQRLQQLI